MPENRFTSEQKAQVVAAIKEAEQQTSGEIRVHLETHCREAVLDRAAHIFSLLKMHKTRERNGVLFYLALEDHQFAILGDVGINHKVPPHFWEDIRDTAIAHFREGRLAKGLSEGIRMAGEQLKAHFPYRSDDKNELSDDISFGH
jgi:uncharacterized membrane protein